ncbi:MAG: cold shock domain-containing protein, partial [Desulfobulbia bacterium]
MGSARTKGTLKKWFGEKGYGFIRPDQGSKDVFVHISAFDRNIPRQPKPGDTIFYHVTTDNSGKTKAADAAIEGAAAVNHTKTRKP